MSETGKKKKHTLETKTKSRLMLHHQLCNLATALFLCECYLSRGKKGVKMKI